MERKKLTHLFWIVALMLFVSGQSFAQNLRVSGRVVDELGEGVIGAGVVVQGTTHGTVTDVDGNYEIPSVPQGAALEFSCVGYKTLVVQVTGQRLDVTMAPDSRLIDESVVVAYGSQNKVTITGAVTAVGGDALGGQGGVDALFDDGCNQGLLDGKNVEGQVDLMAHNQFFL